MTTPSLAPAYFGVGSTCIAEELYGSRLHMPSGIGKKNNRQPDFCGLGLTSEPDCLQLMGYHSVSGGGGYAVKLCFFSLAYIIFTLKRF